MRQVPTLELLNDPPALTSPTTEHLAIYKWQVVVQGIAALATVLLLWHALNKR